MHKPSIGSRKIAVIPAVVNDPQFDPPPANWVEQIDNASFLNYSVMQWYWTSD